MMILRSLSYLSPEALFCPISESNWEALSKGSLILDFLSGNVLTVLIVHTGDQHRN